MSAEVTRTQEDEHETYIKATYNTLRFLNISLLRISRFGLWRVTENSSCLHGHSKPPFDFPPNLISKPKTVPSDHLLSTNSESSSFNPTFMSTKDSHITFVCNLISLIHCTTNRQTSIDQHLNVNSSHQTKPLKCNSTACSKSSSKHVAPHHSRTYCGDGLPGSTSPT